MDPMNLVLDSTWVRLKPDPNVGDLPGLFATEMEFVVKGVDINELGLAPTVAEQAASNARGEFSEIPILDDIGLDVFSADEVGILRFPDRSKTGILLVEGSFPDQHPQDWLDQLAAHRRALLAVSSRGPGRYSSLGPWMATWRLGVVHVAVHLTTSGVGISPPENH